MIYYSALAISIVLNAYSLILLKSYALSADALDEKRTIVRRLMDLRLVLCFGTYGAAAFFWLIALFGVDLMVAYPSLSLTYVIIGLIAPRMFSEELSPKRWVGILVIVAGVIVMNIN